MTEPIIHNISKDVKGDALFEYPEHVNAMLTEAEINAAADEYEALLDTISEEFKHRTKIQGVDFVFLTLATALQVARINVMSLLTRIERAGKSQREKALHKQEKKVYEKRFQGDEPGADTRLLDEFVCPTTRGITRTESVPFDQSRRIGGLEEKQEPSFEGANHRFSTLGHDPLLGYVFGVANILTDTISTIRPNDGALKLLPIKNVPMTNVVVYRNEAARRDPWIGGERSTLRMLRAATANVQEETSTLAASVIKQTVHMLTDLWTPTGLFFPGTELLFDKRTNSRLTELISTGDVMKIVGNAAIAMFINWLIAEIHGVFILPELAADDGDFRLAQARVKKVIACSNAMATMSNLVWTGVTRNVKALDVGGLAVTLRELFSDTVFVTKLRYGYLNREASRAYADLGHELLSDDEIEAEAARYVGEES